MVPSPGVRRKAIDVVQAGKSKTFLRITLECGHILSHIHRSNYEKTKGYHLCQDCLEAQKSA